MNIIGDLSQAAASTKRPPVHTKSRSESPPPSVPEYPATPLPISPPATILTNSSPRPLSRRVRRSLNLIRLYSQDRSVDNTWNRVHLSQDEFQALQDALEKSEHLRAWVTDKLRYDYNSVDGELILRMPSPLHDIFAFRLQEVIVRELKALERQEGVSTVVDSIKVAVTSDLRFGNISERERKSPDGSFRFTGSKYPPLVIEVANSQKSADLPHLAESYIERTKGRTKTVITIDLEYRTPEERATQSLPFREAVYSIYRNKLTRDAQTDEWQREAHVDVEDQHFRMHDSTAPTGSMRLLLSDFCPDDALCSTDDRTITIAHEELAKLLEEAEREEIIAEAPSSPSSPETRVRFISKRRRVPTPTLTSEDEAMFERTEEKADAQHLEENSSFSSADVVDVVVERTKRIKTRSQQDSDQSL